MDAGHILHIVTQVTNAYQDEKLGKFTPFFTNEGGGSQHDFITLNGIR